MPRKKRTAYAGVRAKSGWIETTRTRKDGKRVKARQHAVTGLAGKYSAKEMERQMIQIADENGYHHSQIRMETYEHGEAPVETGRDAPGHYSTDAYRENFDRAFSK